MDLLNVWTVAAKDFSLFFKKKGMVLSIILLPLIVSIGLPGIVIIIMSREAPSSVFAPLIDAFSFFFVILAGLIPAGIGSYSFVGEKIEKTFEPLLATPTTDSEILIGKCLVTFLPSIVSIYFCVPIYMALINIITVDRLGYYFFPNIVSIIIFLVVIPLALFMSVELTVFISMKATDVQTAAQYAALIILPFGGIYLLSELDFISLDLNNLLILSGILLFLDILLSIITKWK
jgi:ABC-2 type transport system permease protein